MPDNQEAGSGFSSVVIKCEEPEMSDSDTYDTELDSKPQISNRVDINEQSGLLVNIKPEPYEIESRMKQKFVSNQGIGSIDVAIKYKKTEMSCSDTAFFFEEAKMDNSNEQSAFNASNANPSDPLAIETYIKQENEVYVDPSFATFSTSDTDHNSEDDRSVSGNKKQSELKCKNKTYRCDICKKTFNWQSNLKNHMLTHSGEKPYQCDVCNKNFTRSSNLNDHKRIHTGEKPYKCDICDKTYNRSSGLSKHKNTHTCETDRNNGDDRSVSVNEKQSQSKCKKKTIYLCDVCSKAFTRRGSFRDHILTHTGEKPYQCDVCSMNFTRASNLHDHKRIHTGMKPYKCDICNKTYNRSSGLTKHKNTHTGEKPYQCDICEKCFFQRESLKAHERSHSGERPYQCDVCDKTFVHSSHLRRHKLRHN